MVAPDNSVLNRPAWSALLMRAAAALAAGLAILSGGCILPIPALPMVAPGYGQTYEILDETGQPAGDGLLFLESNGNPTIYGCYEIKGGKAAVPCKLGTRLAASVGPGVPLWILLWSNPEDTTAVPLVPGYIPVLSSGKDWWHGIRLEANSPRGVLRLKKADLAEECLYLVSSVDLSRWLNKEVHLEAGFSGYTAEDQAADEAALRRAVDYAIRRLTELGYPPSPEWFRDSSHWDLPWRDAPKPP